jgi:hypothetical protein
MTRQPMPPDADAPTAPETLPPDDPGTERLLGWLSAYVPSWGSSVVMHVALFVMIAFMAWNVQAPAAEPFAYKADVYSPKQPRIEKRQKVDTKKQKETRGKFKDNASSILKEFTKNPFPDVAANQKQTLEVIGVGGGGDHLGGSPGLGDGGGFFGIGPVIEQEGPRKIVYIVDKSGSMTDSIDFVKYELKRSIGELGDDKEFHVIFYSSGPPIEMPTRRLVNATERNKDMAFGFIDNIVAAQETEPSKAIERAFACKPDMIYLLTDGEFDRQIVEQVRNLNAGRQVIVHTICFLYTSGLPALQQIAEQNGGQCKLVTERDLATLVGGQ